MNNKCQGDHHPPKNTSVELMVLQMLADGETLDGISGRLTGSPFAVHVIASNAIKKLGGSTTTHGVAIALRQGIIN